MDKEEYKRKFQEIVEWAEAETEKIDRNVEIMGLDTNKDKYNKIHQEYERRIKKLKEEFQK